LGQKTGTLTGTQLDPVGTNPNQAIENYQEKVGGPT